MKKISLPSKSRSLALVTLLLVWPANLLLSPVAIAEPSATLPPVSGRPLIEPDGILPADVLARTALLRANVELLRRYMGIPPGPPPLLQGDSAQPAEVYSQALNLETRANRLAFEQVRVVRKESMAVRGETRPHDVFLVVDSALASVLLVKRDMQIKQAIGERIQPESTTPSEVFNAVVSAGSEINNLLQGMTSPSDVFQLVTAATHTAATLHATIPDGGNLPDEPAFESNKMPADVLGHMHRCYQLVTALARSRGIDTLELRLLDERRDQVSPNDVSDMAALLVEQLTRIHSQFPQARQPARAYYPGKRFPSHVYQRVGLLEAILDELVAAYAENAAVNAGG
jgi:hypothetical protein